MPSDIIEAKPELALVGFCKKCRHANYGNVKNGEFQCCDCIAANVAPVSRSSNFGWTTTVSNGTTTDSTWRP